MKLEDFFLAGIVAVSIFAFVVRGARTAQVRDVAYVPTGFTWDQQLGGYSKVGIDGITYLHYT